MDVKLDKQSKIPVYLQIVDQLRAQIMCGALPSGSVLPSERGLAQMLEVHRNTVVKAYGELKSDAWIESRQGIGYVVAVPPPAGDGGEGEARASDKPSRRVNWINEIKDRHLDMEKTFDDLFQRFTDESKYSLGSGISTNEVFRPERVAHDKGDKFLRQKLVSFLSTKGVKASTGEIQILSETNQAVDFIVTLLVQPGDTVVMEEPVHPDMSRAMELAGAKILTVPVDQDGMRVDLLEKLILHKHPRFIFVNSSFHDPTGHILSLERRKKIIEISNTYRVPIVEEDAASELVYEGEKLPPIKAFDTLENVIYIYSFSLTFVTGLSIAVVAANADVIRSLSYLVSVRLMASDWMTQKLLGRYLDDGTIEVAPLAYMRGRTLNDAYVILDEAQNTTEQQMKMFLTRLGFNTTMIITGDVTQVDLAVPRSGLATIEGILGGIDDIAFAHLDAGDVVRHELVGRIVEAYDRHDATRVRRNRGKESREDAR